MKFDHVAGWVGVKLQEDNIAFSEVLSLREIRRRADEKGRYTKVFPPAPGNEAAALELTYNWIPNLTEAAAFSVILPTPWTISMPPAAPSSPAA